MDGLVHSNNYFRHSLPRRLKYISRCNIITWLFVGLSGLRMFPIQSWAEVFPSGECKHSLKCCWMEGLTALYLGHSEVSFLKMPHENASWICLMKISICIPLPTRKGTVALLVLPMRCIFIYFLKSVSELCLKCHTLYMHACLWKQKAILPEQRIVNMLFTAQTEYFDNLFVVRPQSAQLWQRRNNGLPPTQRESHFEEGILPLFLWLQKAVEYS